MTRFTALGDSITLGVGDPVRPNQHGPNQHGPNQNGHSQNGPHQNGVGQSGDSRRGAQRAWRGWAELLADGLPDPELHILAANGACIGDIERDQLPRALAVRPDVASVVFGINDTLRPGFDPDHIAAAAARIVGALRAGGAQVLTMRLPDAGQMLRLPAALARPLARRTHAVNSAVDLVAERFGTLHFDAAGTAAAYDRQMWAVDRLHPNERGHRLIARSFHSLLATTGHPVGTAPAAEPVNPPPGKLAEVTWMATKGTAWVLRRSADLVPYLLAMAVREIRADDEAALSAQSGC